MQVPRSGPYRINGVANHGGVWIRNLTISGGRLTGLVGLKIKGIKGYQGGHDLDGVLLAGDFDLLLSGGVPGKGMVTANVIAATSCRLRIQTDDADIRLSVMPDPSTGIDATARSKGSLRIELEGPPRVPKAGGEISARTNGYESKPVRLNVNAASSSGNITVVSSM